MFLNEDAELKAALESLDMALEVENPFADRFKRLFRSIGSRNNTPRSRIIKKNNKILTEKDVDHSAMNIALILCELSRKQHPEWIPVSISYGIASDFAEIIKKSNIDLTTFKNQSSLNTAIENAGGLHLYDFAILTFLDTIKTKSMNQIKFSAQSFVYPADKIKNASLKDAISNYKEIYTKIVTDVRNYPNNGKWSDMAVNGMMMSLDVIYNTSSPDLKIVSFRIQDYAVRLDDKKKAFSALTDLALDHEKSLMNNNQAYLWDLFDKYSD